jgi:hypothetical protein
MEIEEYFSVAFSAFVLVAVLRLIFYVPQDDIKAEAESIKTPVELFEYVPRYINTEQSDNYDKIIKIADSVGYDWRAAGASFNYGCPPSGCSCNNKSCLLGLVVWNSTLTSFRIWITPDAFADDEDLRLAVLHEMAHVWQISKRGPDDKWSDFSRWDFHGVNPMEATADCLASAWGARGYIYYDCPLDAQRYIHQLYLESLR